MMHRTLKISQLFAKRKWGKNSVSPKITLSGKWLEEAGFKIGEPVKVKVVNNQLIISRS